MGINPVAQYQPSDCTTQTGTAYKIQIDANSRASQRIAARFAPHAQTSPNMSVVVDPASVFDGVTLTEIVAQSTAMITAPVSHPRIDRVVVDNLTGTASVVPGAEAVSPVPPAIPNGKSPIAQILLQTNTAAITNAMITDERNFSSLSVGGFGAQTAIGSAATCDIGIALSRNVKITGTTVITSLGASANTQNPIYLLEFAGALTLTAGAGMLLPGGASISTAAGDTAVAEYLGSGNWRVRSYHRTDGSPTLQISGLLDQITNAPGAILYRGPTGWVALPPPAADGEYIQSSGGLPNWVAQPSLGAMVAIQTQDASSSASLIFDGIDGTFDEYVFDFMNVVLPSGSALYLRTSSDGGATWASGSNDYYLNYLGTAANYAASKSFGYLFSNNASPVSGKATLFQPANTTQNKFFDVSTVSGNTSTFNSAKGIILHPSTAAVNAVLFASATGNILSGRITMYGIKHA